MDGVDPYEVTKHEWKNDVDLWPVVTHVHVCMYLMHLLMLDPTLPPGGGGAKLGI